MSAFDAAKAVVRANSGDLEDASLLLQSAAEKLRLPADLATEVRTLMTGGGPGIMGNPSSMEKAGMVERLGVRVDDAVPPGRGVFGIREAHAAADRLLRERGIGMFTHDLPPVHPPSVKIADRGPLDALSFSADMPHHPETASFEARLAVFKSITEPPTGGIGTQSVETLIAERAPRPSGADIMREAHRRSTEALRTPGIGMFTHDLKDV